MEEVYQFAKSYLELEQSKVEEILKNLVRKGILKEGITLAF